MAKALGRVIYDEQPEPQPAQPAQPVDYSQFGPRAQQAGPTALGRVMEPIYQPTGPKTEIIPPAEPGGVPQVAGMPPRREPTTLGGRALGLGEVGLQMGTGSIADIAGGIGGIARTITAGPEEGAKTVKGIQEALTYEPRMAATKEGLADVAYNIAPVVSPVMEGYQKLSDVAAEKGGPLAGAAVATLPTAITEIAGLKGTRELKQRLLRGLLKDAGPEEILNRAGKLRPEIAQAARYAEMNIDELATQGQVLKTAEQAGRTAKKIRGKQAAMERLAEQAAPSKELIDIYDDFGLKNWSAAEVSKSPSFQAASQGIATVPGSKITDQAAKHYAEVGQAGKDIIKELGGTTEKTQLSDAFRQKTMDTVDELEKAYDELYKKVENAVPTQEPVKASNTLQYIEDKAARVKETSLTKLEKHLRSVLSDEAEPFYGTIDIERKRIGRKLNKEDVGEIYKDTEPDDLKGLYGAMAQDQRVAAAKYGVGDVYTDATQKFAQRADILKRSEKLIGRELTGNITTKAKKAMLDLGRKDTKAWDEMLRNLPKELGPEQKREIFATALSDAMVGTRTMTDVGVKTTHFDDFMRSINSNAGALKRFERVFGKQGVNRLNRYAKVVGGMRRAYDKNIWTGRAVTVPGVMDEVKTISDRLYGPTKKIAGKATFGLIDGILEKTPRSIAADELLTSPQFKSLLYKHAQGEFDSPAKIARANEMIQKLNAFKKFKRQLNKSELKTLAKVGVLGHLTGLRLKEEEKE